MIFALTTVVLASALAGLAIDALLRIAVGRRT